MARRRKKKLRFVGGHGGTTVEHRAIDDRSETLRGSVFAGEVCQAPVMVGRGSARHEKLDETERDDEANHHNRYLASAVRPVGGRSTLACSFQVPVAPQVVAPSPNERMLWCRRHRAARVRFGIAAAIHAKQKYGIGRVRFGVRFRPRPVRRSRRARMRRLHRQACRDRHTRLRER